MNKFAWFISLRSLDDVIHYFKKDKYRLNKKIIHDDFKNLLLEAPPFTFLKIKNVKSPEGKEIEGYVIIVPLLPTQVVVEKENVLIKLKSAIKISKELGVSFISLGGLLALYGQGAVDIAKESEVYVTTAKNYTAAIVTSAIEKAASLKNLRLNNAKVTILGIDTPLGAVCLKILNKYSPRFIFVENIDKKVNEITRKTGRINFEIEKNLKAALEKSDIVLISTSDLTADINPHDLNSHSIVCDAIPPFLNARKIFQIRNDILVFEGTRVGHYSFSVGKRNKKWNMVFSGKDIFACIGEAMILAFEDKFENYSIGNNNISVNRAEDIYRLGIKHGFHVADFRCSEKVFNKNQLQIMLQ